MDIMQILGIALIAVGILAVVGIRLLPVKKTWAIVGAVIGVLIVTGGLASLLSGVGSTVGLATTQPVKAVGEYKYAILASSGSSGVQIDETTRTILFPEVVNHTTKTVDVASPEANFTISIADGTADMRGVKVECSTEKFYTQNVTKSDSTQYMVVSKATDGQADIRVADSTGAYTRRSRTFLLGGESTSGQSVTARVYFTVDATALDELNTYNSKPIVCNVAGDVWALNVQKSSVVS
jgi:hypothetical protein